MFASIEHALKAFARGEMLVVIDDEDRENEGDLILAAEAATADRVAFIVRHTSGVICAPITEKRRLELAIPMMVGQNEDPKGTAFTASVDYRMGTSTGISAADRAVTISALADVRTRSEGFSRPGHVFPLVAKDGGVLARAGHTEAAIDLAGAAGLSRAGAICELVSGDGTMMRTPELARFAKRHRLPFITIEALRSFRLRSEIWVEQVNEGYVQTRFGQFSKFEFFDAISNKKHIACWIGDLSGAPLVRAQRACKTAHNIIGIPCACEDSALASLRMIAMAESGCLLLIDQNCDSGAQEGDALSASSAAFTALTRQILTALGIANARFLLNPNEELDHPENLGLADVSTTPITRSSIAAVSSLRQKPIFAAQNVTTGSLIEAG